MTTVLSRKELKQQTTAFVYVERDAVVYNRVGDEWVRKLYFTTREAREILNIPLTQVYELCENMGIQAKAWKNYKLKITLTQLRAMAQQL